jgi:hypothetical protein
MLDGWVGEGRCEGYLDTTSQQVDTWIYIFRRLVKCRMDFGWRQKKNKKLTHNYCPTFFLALMIRILG